MKVLKNVGLFPKDVENNYEKFYSWVVVIFSSAKSF